MRSTATRVCSINCLWMNWRLGSQPRSNQNETDRQKTSGGGSEVAWRTPQLDRPQLVLTDNKKINSLLGHIIGESGLNGTPKPCSNIDATEWVWLSREVARKGKGSRNLHRLVVRQCPRRLEDSPRRTLPTAKSSDVHEDRTRSKLVSSGDIPEDDRNRLLNRA
jgi:hypothetical protein